LEKNAAKLSFSNLRYHLYAIQLVEYSRRINDYRCSFPDNTTDLDNCHNSRFPSNNISLIIPQQASLLQARLKFINLRTRVSQTRNANNGMICSKIYAAAIQEVKARPLAQAQQINPFSSNVLSELAGLDKEFSGILLSPKLIEEFGVNEVDLTEICWGRPDVQAGPMLHRDSKMAVAFDS
jgi:hypothetical protein